MKFIVIEGLDGAGKSTQLQYLFQYLQKHNKAYEYIKFPRTGSPVFGDLVARFLRGELGPIETVNPYLVALIYAGDRADAASALRQSLREGKLVVADRYVYSNIAYQCAKLEDPAEQERLAEWILNLEYGYYQIPQPDLSLFLDVPDEFTRRNLTASRTGSDRDYLNGKEDIHEKDLDFQKKVKEVYLNSIQKDTHFLHIVCAEENRMLPPDAIFNKILMVLNEFQIV